MGNYHFKKSGKKIRRESLGKILANRGLAVYKDDEPGKDVPKTDPEKPKATAKPKAKKPASKAKTKKA